MVLFNYFFLILIQLNIFSFRLSSAVYVPSDWPTQKELMKYLSAVQNVVDYCAEYTEDVDLNLAFGLFVTNINLGHAFQEKQRTIPENIRNKIKNIIDDNNVILNDFKDSLIESDEGDEKTKRLNSIFSLLYNASYWVENMEKFVYNIDKTFTLEQFREIYSPFGKYMKKVDNFYRGFPSPVISDACLVSLSKTPLNVKRSPPRCSVNDICYDMLKRGTNFGYSLTHRIVFLVMARFGRGCSVFSKQADRALVKQLCSMAHTEAEYIAENNYKLVDLFMEIIAICAVDGHAQFLRRNWLDNILNFESPDGCYGTIPVKKFNSVGRSFLTTELGKYNNLLKEGCSAHTTGLAAAAFSGAVRFIIEDNY